MLRARIRTPTDREVIRDFSNVHRMTFGRASDNEARAAVTPAHAGLESERSIEVLRWEARAGRRDAERVELLAAGRPWATGAEDDTRS